METLLLILIFLFWCCGTFLLWRIPLLKNHEDEDNLAEALSIIIPARNEARNLPLLLKSLNGQKVRPLEIIVVDDHSDDKTSEIAKGYNVQVITSEKLPDGWLGKPWSCWQGAREAKGRFLLFLDADTVLEKDGISHILSALKSRKGLVSVQPFHQMERAYEQLSAVFNIITMAGARAFTILGESLRPLGAFGPCIALSREDYMAMGGHGAVRACVLENLALGRLFADAKRPLSCYGGRKSINFRMYPEGFASLFEGFSKGFATGANIISPLILILSIAWIVGGMAVTRHLIQAIIVSQPSNIFIWLLLYILFAVQVSWMLKRIGNFKIFTAIFYPVPLLFFVIVFIWSLLLTFVLRRAKWKDRDIDVGANRRRS